MAVTNNTNAWEKERQQAADQYAAARNGFNSRFNAGQNARNGGYNGLKGVSGSTAGNLAEYQQGYRQSDAVNAAQQNLGAVQAAKPQGYNSKYGAALDSIMQQVQNPGAFNYEFNGDNLFKNYADLYTQKGRQASLDTMGQAAALTGGYGNSYAQAAANQAYQQNLLPLYDVGLQLSQQAYQRYNDQLNNQKDAYSMMSDAEARNYSQYRDQMADWQREEAQAYDRYADERDTDYNRYRDMLDYYTGLAQVENAAYNTEQERNEAIRQYEQNFAENRRQYDTSLAENARQYDTSMAENQRQANMDDAYRYAQLGENSRQADQNLGLGYAQLGETARSNDMDDAYRYAALGENARQANQSMDYNYANLAENARQANQSLQYNYDAMNADDAYRYAALMENQRQANQSLAENARQADQSLQYNYDAMNADDAYRYAALAQNQGQFDADDLYRYTALGQNADQMNLDDAYRWAALNQDAANAANDLQYRYDAMNTDDTYRWAQLMQNQGQFDADDAYRYAALSQNQGQFDADDAYRYAALAQNQNQFDADEAYRRDTLGWNMQTDQRDYDESVRQYDQNTALNYVKMFMERGIAPSMDLLAAAGLSQEDAQRLFGMGMMQVPQNISVNVNGAASTPVYYPVVDANGNTKYYGYGADGKLTQVSAKVAKKGIIDTKLADYGAKDPAKDPISISVPLVGKGIAGSTVNANGTPSAGTGGTVSIGNIAAAIAPVGGKKLTDAEIKKLEDSLK